MGGRLVAVSRVERRCEGRMPLKTKSHNYADCIATADGLLRKNFIQCNRIYVVHSNKVSAKAHLLSSGLDLYSRLPDFLPNTVAMKQKELSCSSRSTPLATPPVVCSDHLVPGAPTPRFLVETPILMITILSNAAVLMEIARCKRICSGHGCRDY